MAILALDLPLDQPIRFVPLDGELPVDPRDNIKHFDSDWFANTIRDWQAKTDYIQPWQFNDRLAVYLKTNSVFGATLELMDCSGNIVKTWQQSNPVAGVLNDRIRVGSGSVGANVYLFQFRFADVVNLLEGIYWLVLTANYRTVIPGQPPVDYFRKNISEPLSIAAKHPSTVRVDYYDTENTATILYAITGVRFSHRVSADIVDYSPASTDTQYEDGEYNAQMLASQAYRTCKFALTKRVPEWVLDRLNRAWGCNKVSVDGKAFTKDIGAKWEMNRVARVPKIIAALPIRESFNDEGSTQVTATSFTVFSAPTFPYVVRRVMLYDSNGSTPLLPNQFRVIRNNTEQAAFINEINAYAASIYLSGSLSISGGVATWNIGAGELFLSGDANVLINPLTAQVVTTNILQAITLTNPDAVIDYGDNSAAEVAGNNAVGTPVHNYATSGTWNVNIFGKYTGISFNDGYLAAIGGKASASTIGFTVMNTFSLPTLDATVLSLAAPVIQRINVYQCLNLSNVTGLNTLVTPSLFQLKFNNNKLTTTVASDIVRFAHVKAQNFPGVVGSVNTVSQTPPAPMNAAGNLAKGSLINVYGWTVTTD